MIRQATLSAALVLFASVGAHAADDALTQSFDRMFAHAPASGAVAAPAGQAADPLLAAMVVPLRDGFAAPQPRHDAVLAGFTRMLQHAPSRHTPALPASVGADPLQLAMVEPLRNGLAGVPAVRLAAVTR